MGKSLAEIIPAPEREVDIGLDVAARLRPASVVKGGEREDSGVSLTNSYNDPILYFSPSLMGLVTVGDGLSRLLSRDRAVGLRRKQSMS